MTEVLSREFVAKFLTATHRAMVTITPFFYSRGRFDGRNVAVKRILPECFSFADREVGLLYSFLSFVRNKKM